MKKRNHLNALFVIFFSKNQYLKTHKSTVHEANKSFDCNTCIASFASMADLNRHVTSVHEGKKLFQCNACDASFAQNSDLKKNKASVHEGNKPFKSAVFVILVLQKRDN